MNPIMWELFVGPYLETEEGALFAVLCAGCFIIAGLLVVVRAYVRSKISEWRQPKDKEMNIETGSKICKWLVYAGLALFLVFVWAHEARGQTVGLHLATYHDQKGYENTNPGAYIRLDSGWTAGAYRNSVKKASIHGGYTWSKPYSLGDFSVTAGAVTGYERKLQPLLVPSVRMAYFRLTLLPRSDPKGTNGVHLSAEF